MRRWTCFGVCVLGLVLSTAVACDKSGSGSNHPNVIESAANDIGHEIDGAGNSARGVGDDVAGGADDVVDKVDGSDADRSPDAAPAPSDPPADDAG